MRDEFVPTRRRVVAAWTLVVAVAITGLVALTETLRFDHPAAGPQTPELEDGVDPLRDEVECELPVAREGTERPVAMAEPELPRQVTSSELYDCPTTWDGRRVRYVGEAVGAVLQRDDHAWIQLNDDVYADGIGPLPTHRDFRGGNAGIGARVAPEHAAMIEAVGGPTQRGDLIEVVAEFRRVDPESHEVAILRVETLRVLRRGEAFALPTTGARPVVAVVMAGVMVVVVAVERRRRER